MPFPIILVVIAVLSLCSPYASAACHSGTDPSITMFDWSIEAVGAEYSTKVSVGNRLHVAAEWFGDNQYDPQIGPALWPFLFMDLKKISFVAGRPDTKLRREKIPEGWHGSNYFAYAQEILQGQYEYFIGTGQVLGHPTLALLTITAPYDSDGCRRTALVFVKLDHVLAQVTGPAQGGVIHGKED